VFSKLIFQAALGLLFVFTGFSQVKSSENYAEIFSTDYQRALQFIKNEPDSIIRSQKLNPKEVIAIVFPEIIRYSSIQDKIETFALESLYVQYGKAYANFSVGEFQIKPAFAERIEIDFLKLFGEKELFAQLRIFPSDTIQNPVSRSKRLKRIRDKTGMTNYVCLFFKVMEMHYPAWTNTDEKIKFFACAYNCGYEKSKAEIEKYLTKKFFYVGLSFASPKYSYADVAWDYFNR
jgi:hypothetical protein